MMKKAKDLAKKSSISLIIPAFKQQKTIQRDLKKILEIMKKLKRPFEIIVVVDGIVDKTRENAKQVKSRRIKIIGYKHNHGKGYAVRYGMANSLGNTIAFLDAGMDLDPNSLEMLLDIMKKKNADIVIGSKLHPESKVYYPWQRKILSWGYRNYVRLFFGLSIRDTQVGIKIFKRNVLIDVLPLLLVKKYAFDIEILAVANHLGYKKIFEAPITLKFRNWSSITSTNFLKAIFFMLWDTTAVYYRLKIIRYYNSKSKRKWKFDPELNFRVNI